jgi:hypothetical protein
MDSKDVCSNKQSVNQINCTVPHFYGLGQIVSKLSFILPGVDWRARRTYGSAEMPIGVHASIPVCVELRLVLRTLHT